MAHKCAARSLCPGVVSATVLGVEYLSPSVVIANVPYLEPASFEGLCGNGLQ